jgi:hypothetical protein
MEKGEREEEMKSPRERFLEIPGSMDALAQLVGSRVFEDAADAALLSMIETIDPRDVGSSFMLAGAKRFRDNLINLSKPFETPKPVVNTGLDYNQQSHLTKPKNK